LERLSSRPAVLDRYTERTSHPRRVTGERRVEMTDSGATLGNVSRLAPCLSQRVRIEAKPLPRISLLAGGAPGPQGSGASLFPGTGWCAGRERAQEEDRPRCGDGPLCFATRRNVIRGSRLTHVLDIQTV